tara:strand:+ start:1099 stop:1782 length:684 start_codon:yes stop_codon:yes gene_type:complete
MTIFYAGDIHGKVDHVASIDRAAVEAGVTHVIQVGDFGARWGGVCPIFRYFDKRARKGRDGATWITCGGNHDNWNKWNAIAAKQGHPGLVELAPGCFFAQRGSVHEVAGVKHIFLGGAESTDRHVRIPGKDWWAGETPTYAEFSLFAARLEDERPEVVVTHDAPLRVQIVRSQRKRAATPNNLENIIRLSDYSPARWYFGHHHSMDEYEVEGVRYICCGLHGQYKQA